MPADEGLCNPEDPDSCKVHIYCALFKAIKNSSKRLTSSSFGLTEKTLKQNWAKKPRKWLPRPATLEEIIRSYGFKHLPSLTQRFIICSWILAATKSASRGSPASESFVRAMTHVVEYAPENVWYNLPPKLAA